MKIISLLVCITAMAVFTLTLSTPLYSTSGCQEDCMKCHSLNNEEASKILKDLKITDTKILNIQMSPLKGLWELNIEKEGKKGVFYVDFSKKYVVSGSIIEIKTSINKTQERLSFSPINFIPQHKIPLKDALILGNQKAAKKVIIFTDPDCPFCGKLHNELKKIVEKRNDISFYIKLFPLRIHKDAYLKSKTILCEKSLKLLEDNFEGKPIPKPKCEANEIDDNIKLASELGISGTPTIIMPDGRVFQGFYPAEKLIGIIDSK